MERDGLASRIGERAALAGAPVDDALAEHLARYVELLMRWNARMNLTGLTDDASGLDRLVAEPLAAAARLRRGETRIIDVGSGGGSPAVPMALARPDIQLRMVESKGRKAAFLREVVRRLSLQGAQVDACRYEELARRLGDEQRAHVVTVRAVRVQEDGFKALARLVVDGGRLFLFEGQDGGGGEVGRAVFEVEGVYQLVGALQSRLVVLVKREQKA